LNKERKKEKNDEDKETGTARNWKEEQLTQNQKTEKLRNNMYRVFSRFSVGTNINTLMFVCI
jgi:hypothetical protein